MQRAVLDEALVNERHPLDQSNLHPMDEHFAWTCNFAIHAAGAYTYIHMRALDILSTADGTTPARSYR